MNPERSRKIALGSILIVLAGCATNVPVGPRVAVMPAAGKPFDQFVNEEHVCRQYAEQSTGLPPNDVATKNEVGSAAAGVAIGTVAGALLGGDHNGAAAGAGLGLIAGSAGGANQAERASRDAQRRYDIAYEQCMYAKGNQVPGYAAQRRIAPPNAGYSQTAPHAPPPPPQ
ncbi:MAG TPA: hypothetical protein VFF41_04365 [Gallionella sp.]|nr:hypothetical protein [Gallionella sp.]